LERLVSFVLLSLMIDCSFGLSVLLTWSALALLVWNVFRARHDIFVVFNSARCLARHATQSAGKELIQHGLVSKLIECSSRRFVNRSKQLRCGLEDVEFYRGRDAPRGILR
jgi:hypothetical protein